TPPSWTCGVRRRSTPYLKSTASELVPSPFTRMAQSPAAASPSCAGTAGKTTKIPTSKSTSRATKNMGVATRYRARAAWQQSFNSAGYRHGFRPPHEHHGHLARRTHHADSSLRLLLILSCHFRGCQKSRDRNFLD